MTRTPFPEDQCDVSDADVTRIPDDATVRNLEAFPDLYDWEGDW